MQIPARLAEKLSRNQSLDGIVKLSIAEFEPWIKGSNLPFFPEYTDHGINHLEQVLATASSLISDQAWHIVTPDDVAVLILSVLLHDSAMHLTESGFVALLSDPWKERTITYMEDPTWSILWEDFLREASRFDGRKLIALFGTPEPVRRPPLDPLRMELRDRLLIGEFLRRHHPRLAQEIAIYNVPSPHSSTLSLKGCEETSSKHIAELAGIVARSHGTHIRTLLPILEKRFGRDGRRECRGVHPAFLMTVLRIADYVQVHSERAPERLLRITTLHSPTSLREWMSHHAIRDIRTSTDDPEAIYIQAHPDNVESYFRIQEWNNGIQHELDESWAVLGEVYGRVEQLAHLGLVIRRVRCNLDEITALDGEIDYLPLRASFRAADADLLKLLITPLYGDSPGIGMRELIQNALDAVRELRVVLADRNQTTADIELTQQAADVICSIDKDAEGQHWVSVSDNGIGMSSDVIINYFLNAGASFRRSDDWRKSFETAGGESKVLRAGRFGVGALAAFLLGSEIHVTTRAIDAEEGIGFKATVESEIIPLKRINRPVGTTIRIPISKTIAAKLSSQPRSKYDTDGWWDWYVFSQPSLKRVAYGKELARKYVIESIGDDIPEWMRIDSRDFSGVFWRYGSGPQLTCNGIVIPEDSYSVVNVKSFRTPNILVNDPNGKLPLSLDRSELSTRQVSFADDLALDLTKYLCAFALSRLPTSLGTFKAAFKELKKCRFDKLHGYGDGFAAPWLFTSEGVGLYHSAVLHRMRVAKVVLLRLAHRFHRLDVFEELLSSDTAYAFGQPEATNGGLVEWLDAALNANPDKLDVKARREGSLFSPASKLLMDSARLGTRLLTTRFAIESLEERQRLTGLLKRTKIEWETNGWVMLAIGDISATTFPFHRFAKQIRAPRNGTLLVEATIDSRSPTASPLPLLVDRWMQVLGQLLVPVDKSARMAQLSNAYRILAPYIEANENELRLRKEAREQLGD